MQIWVSVGKMSKLYVFDIFCDILDKMKGNLGQECVKRGLLSYQGKADTIDPDFLGKMTVFSVLVLLFHLSLPKIWSSYSCRNYIFEV